MDARERWQGVELGPYLNHACASDDGDPFAAMGYSSFPAEELSALPRPLVAGGVPLWLARFGGRRPDNVRCDGQTVAVPPGGYCALALLGASELGSYREPLRLLLEGGEEARELGLTRWILPQPKYGEVLAHAVTHMHGAGTPLVASPGHLWLQVVVLDQGRALHGLVLPENVLMHILAMTLIRPPAAAGAGMPPAAGPPPAAAGAPGAGATRGAPAGACPANCPAGRPAVPLEGPARQAAPAAAPGEVMACPLRT